MSRSLIEELASTTPARLGVASWPIRATILILWGLVMLGFGEMWIFKDMRLSLATQRAELVRLNREVNATEKAEGRMSAQQATQTPGGRENREESVEMLRGAYQVIGPLPAPSVWLTSANLLANQLSLDGVIDTAVWSDPEPDTSLQYKGLSDGAPWSSGQTSNPHLQAVTSKLYSAKLEGDVVALLAWLDGIMRAQGRGRVWLHQLQMARALHALQGVESARFQMQVVLSTVGLSATHHETKPEQLKPFVINGERDLLWRESLGERPWGRGSQAHDWWQALPLSHLELVGIAHMDEASWAWVLDPRGNLHRLFVDTEVARPPHRVVAIESQGVSVVDLATQTRLSWVIGEPW